MFNQIKNKLDKELIRYLSDLNKRYRFNYGHFSLLKNIKTFLLGDGKRLRPILFIFAYKGFSNKNPKNLYRCALSMELIHNFLLVHDDIIDKADIRRGKPTMHLMLEREITYKGKAKFTGQDLAIVVGDIIYAIAIESFLSIVENPLLKEKALIKFIEAAYYTGLGQYLEIIYGAKELGQITKKDIYKIYDYKTAYYTFLAPLVSAAILAKTKKEEITKLSKLAINLGRAFQIKDDILGVFGDENKTGKSALTDLKENKKTILTWWAYNKSSKEQKLRLSQIMYKIKPNQKDMSQAKKIITDSQALGYAKKEIVRLQKKSLKILNSSKMKNTYKLWLSDYIKQILTV